jgi:hypothetical protein
MDKRMDLKLLCRVNVPQKPLFFLAAASNRASIDFARFIILAALWPWLPGPAAARQYGFPFCFLYRVRPAGSPFGGRRQAADLFFELFIFRPFVIILQGIFCNQVV